MKRLLLSFLLGLMAVPALAGNLDNHSKRWEAYATERFAVAGSDGATACGQVADVLSRISSPELSISINENCQLNRHHGRAVRVLARIGMGLGTYGFSEIGCAVEHSGVGCGPSFDYIGLGAYVTARGAARGQEVALSPEECALQARILSTLHFTTRRQVLLASCEQGVLKTRLAVSR